VKFFSLGTGAGSIWDDTRGAGGPAALRPLTAASSSTRCRRQTNEQTEEHRRRVQPPFCDVNPLEFTGNYSATSNNKLVYTGR